MKRALAMLLGAVVYSGCAQPGADSGDAPLDTAPAMTHEVQEGPIKATVAVSPAEPRLGDPVELVLTVTAEAGVSVTMPPFGEALGRFAIADFADRKVADAEPRVFEQRYTLEIPASGRHRIPPLRIEFTDAREASDAAAAPRELLTDEIPLAIAPVVDADDDSLRPPRGALVARNDAQMPWLAAGIAAGVLVLAGLAWFGLRRGRRAAERPAHETALARLDALEARGAPSPEEADTWYVELSDVIRRYIEDRFGLRAPELTTEEFLQQSGDATFLTAEDRDLLSRFLAQCDRVKFAGYQPEHEESQAALESARRFVEHTRPKQDTSREDAA